MVIIWIIMSRLTESLKRNYVPFIILLTGLTVSGAIYWTAGDGADEAIMAQMQGSKKYIHDMELLGGKMNVMVSDFMAWFGSLWRGRQLALTVAAITVATSGAVFLFSTDKDER